MPHIPFRKVGLEIGIDPNSPRIRTMKGRFKAVDELVVQEKMRLR